MLLSRFGPILGQALIIKGIFIASLNLLYSFPIHLAFSVINRRKYEMKKLIYYFLH